jgi:uncharacterized protein YjiS (DUF1127 family)
MSQTTQPSAGSPEYLFSQRQTAPLAFRLPTSDEYMLNQDDIPTAPLPAVPRVSYTLRQKRPSHRFALALVMILLLALMGVGFGSALLHSSDFSTHAPTPPPIFGQIHFLSSDQLSGNNSQGICDEVEINLTHLAPPAPGKRYYAWLLHDTDQSEGSDMLLGTLSVSNGTTYLFYPGDAEHSNLLAVMSRFLVTEEDATITPINPSPDKGTWRYVGAFAQQAAANGAPGTSQFSYLDHLRHLLASDPLLDELELPGGLITWLYRNTGKELEWSMSLRDHWEEDKDVSFLRRQTARILAYLDGISYVQQDLPPNTSLTVNERLARIGLLTVQTPTQDPPAYLEHIVSHLYGLIQTSNSPGSLRKPISEIITALSNVQLWLEQMRTTARQLLQMSDEQLMQPATLMLLDTMIDNATRAYTGQTDPITGNRHEGVTWIHDFIQAVAVLDVTAYAGNSSSIQMIQDMHHGTALSTLYEDTP